MKASRVLYFKATVKVCRFFGLYLCCLKVNFQYQELIGTFENESQVFT